MKPGPGLGRGLPAASGAAGREKASGGVVAAAARLATVEGSVGVRAVSAARASGVAAPAGNGAAAAVVRAASGVEVPVASGVEHRASAGVRRANGVAAPASAGVAANAVVGGRTGPGARRLPAPRIPFGWRSAVGESSCTATPVSWW